MDTGPPQPPPPGCAGNPDGGHAYHPQPPQQHPQYAQNAQHHVHSAQIQSQHQPQQFRPLSSFETDHLTLSPQQRPAHDPAYQVHSQANARAQPIYSPPARSYSAHGHDHMHAGHGHDQFAHVAAGFSRLERHDHGQGQYSPPTASLASSNNSSHSVEHYAAPPAGHQPAYSRVPEVASPRSASYPRLPLPQAQLSGPVEARHFERQYHSPPEFSGAVPHQLQHQQHQLQHQHSRLYPRPDAAPHHFAGPRSAVQSPVNSPYVDAQHLQQQQQQAAHYPRAFSTESLNSGSAYSPVARDSPLPNSKPISPRMAQYESPQLAQHQQAASSPPTSPYFPSRAGFPMPGPARVHPQPVQQRQVHAHPPTQHYDGLHRDAAAPGRHPAPQQQQPMQPQSLGASQPLPSGVYQPQLRHRPAQQPDPQRPISIYIPPKPASSNPTSTTPTSPAHQRLMSPDGHHRPLPLPTGSIGFPIYPPVQSYPPAPYQPDASSGPAPQPLPPRRNPMSIASLLDDTEAPPSGSSSAASTSHSRRNSSAGGYFSSPPLQFPLVSSPTSEYVHRPGTRPVPSWPMPAFGGGAFAAGSAAPVPPLKQEMTPAAATDSVAKPSAAAGAAVKPPPKKKRKIGTSGSAASSPGLPVLPWPGSDSGSPAANTQGPAGTKKNKLDGKERGSTPVGSESRPGSALGKAAAAAAKKESKEREKEKEKEKVLEKAKEKEKDKDKDKGPLYCTCRTPYDESKFYIECDGCQDWLHGACVSVTPQQSKAFDLFYCNECTLLGRGVTTKHARCKYPPCTARADTLAKPNSSSFCSPACGRAWADMQLDQGPLDLAPVLAANSPIGVPAAAIAAAAASPIGAWTHVDEEDARTALAAVRAIKRIRSEMRSLDAKMHVLSQHALEMVPEHKRPKPKADPQVVDGEAHHVSSEAIMPSSESTLTSVPGSDATTASASALASGVAPSSSVPGSDATDAVMVSSNVDSAAPRPPVCGCPIQIDEADGRVVRWCERVKCSKHGMWRRVLKARLEVERVKLLDAYRVARVELEQAMARVARRRRDWDRILFHATHVEDEEAEAAATGVEPSAGVQTDEDSMDVDPPIETTNKS